MDKKRKEVVQDVKQIIISIVNEEHKMSLNTEDFKDEDNIAMNPLLELDSLMAIRLVVEVEKAFGIEIPDEDLDMENFKSAADIAKYVEVNLVKSNN